MQQGTEVDSSVIPQLIADAIAREDLAAITLPGDSTVRIVKSPILTYDNDGFWVQVPAQDRDLIELLVNQRMQVRVVIAGAAHRVAMNCVAQSRYSGRQMSHGTTIDALQLSWPRTHEILQTRHSYRVRLTPFSGVTIQIWRMDNGCDLLTPPKEENRLPIDVRDISSGGMGVVISANVYAAVNRVAEHDRLRIYLEYKDHKLLLEGRIRYPHCASRVHDVHAGIEFCHAKSHHTSGKVASELAKIVSELQREELRRIRRAV